MHYQESPHQEAKFVRCTRGAIYDIIIDLRADSPIRGQWHGAPCFMPLRVSHTATRL